MALRLRYHDAATHLRRVPRGETAARRSSTRWSRRASRRWAPAAWPASPRISPPRGGALRASAATPAIKTKRGRAARRRSALLAREPLTGAPPPAAARRGRAVARRRRAPPPARDFQKLRERSSDQAAFARAARQLLPRPQARRGRRPTSRTTTEDDEADGPGEPADGAVQRDRRRPERFRAKATATARRARRPRTLRAGGRVRRRSPTRPRPRCRWPGRRGGAGRAERPGAAATRFRNEPLGQQLPRLHREVRRDRRGRPSCATPEELTRLRSISTSSSAICRA